MGTVVVICRCIPHVMGRLKGISAILSPDLLHALSSMGHGDEIVLADANFPTSSICRDGGAKEIRADGHQIPAILEAILQLMPLDTYCWSPASVMDVTDSDRCKGLPILRYGLNTDSS